MEKFQTVYCRIEEMNTQPRSRAAKEVIENTDLYGKDGGKTEPKKIIEAATEQQKELEQQERTRVDRQKAADAAEKQRERDIAMLNSKVAAGLIGFHTPNNMITPYYGSEWLPDGDNFVVSATHRLFLEFGTTLIRVYSKRAEANSKLYKAFLEHWVVLDGLQMKQQGDTESRLYEQFKTLLNRTQDFVNDIHQQQSGVRRHQTVPAAEKG